MENQVSDRCVDLSEENQNNTIFMENTVAKRMNKIGHPA